MEDDEIERVRMLQLSMLEPVRPDLIDSDFEDLRVLIRLAVEFYDYLTATPPWPQFPEDPFQNMTYAVDKILINSGSFFAAVHLYGILVGPRQSTIDWNGLCGRSLREAYLSVYREFLAEANFEAKCRHLLDLAKLQIMYAGAFYDCHP